MRVEDIDEMLSSQARLAVAASLMPGRSVCFSDLKTATGLADGNLHVQTRKLADAGYLTITKIPRGQRTRTSYRITEMGHLRFRLHVQKLQEVLEGSEGVVRPMTGLDRRDDSQVW